ncbi:uncharacterized protein [Aristolochia californica]|uniref:uncharacterized protein n=1 Tax=Aristolochia californica TaxID=171875 RepID=UPI0035E32A02
MGKIERTREVFWGKESSDREKGVGGREGEEREKGGRLRWIGEREKRTGGRVRGREREAERTFATRGKRESKAERDKGEGTGRTDMAVERQRKKFKEEEVMREGGASGRPSVREREGGREDIHNERKKGKRGLEG